MAVTTFEAPPEALVGEFKSPSFAVENPYLSNANLVPRLRLSAMEQCWGQRIFPEKKIRFSSLKDVFVVEEGLVFDADLRLLSASRTQHSDGEIERGQLAVREALRAGHVPTQAGVVVLAKKRGVDNYGHWLIEMLPKVFLAKQHIGSNDLRYSVPEASGAMGDVISQSLAMIDVLPHAIVSHGRKPMHFDELLVVDGLSVHGRYMSPCILDCLDHISAQVAAEEAARIFVSRLSHGARCFEQEAALLELLEARGFRVLDPSSSSFKEQVAVFKGASMVAGAMGAGMTNIVFAPSATPIVTFAPATMPDTFFWFIANLRRQVYHEVRCVQSGPIRGFAEWDTDLLFSPKAVLDILEGVEQSGLTKAWEAPVPKPKLDVECCTSIGSETMVEAMTMERTQAAKLPELTGEDYLAVLARLQRTLQPRSYLEIGSRSGGSLSLANCPSIAIDPGFNLNPNFHGEKSFCGLYRMTSDAFFQSFDPQAIFGRKIDFAFLDGLHLAEFLLRDFLNTERHCARNSIIALHDCIPVEPAIARRHEHDAEAARQSTHRDWWTGDVWKTILVLRKFRPDLRIHAVDAYPTGLVLITNLDPDSGHLQDNYFTALDYLRTLDLEEVGTRNYIDSLQMIPTRALTTFEQIGQYFWL